MFLVRLSTQVDKKDYKAILKYTNRQGEHVREYIEVGEPGESNLRLELKAVLMGIEKLKKQSEITIKTRCGYIKTGFDYLDNWKENNWTKPNGKPVANVDLWKKLEEFKKKHSHKIIVCVER